MIIKKFKTLGTNQFKKNLSHHYILTRDDEAILVCPLSDSQQIIVLRLGVDPIRVGLRLTWEHLWLSRL